MGKYKELQAKINSIQNSTVCNITIKRTNNNRNLILQLLKEGQIAYTKTKEKTYTIYLKKYFGKPNIHEIQHIPNTHKSIATHLISHLNTLTYVTDSRRKSYLTHITRRVMNKTTKILRVT